MKNLIYLLMLCFFSFCSRVTTQPDKQATTSGTMGSVKATTTIPPSADTTMVDSATIKQDSLLSPR